MIPDLSVLWVIFFVLLITTLLNVLLFKPLLSVMDRRESAVRSAREMAEQAAERARLATDELEAKTRAARAEVYAQMDESRRAAEAHRAELLSAAREAAARSSASAIAELRAETDVARERLTRDADALGAVIADRVLGRQTS